jgi:NAD dependent epimerase/dehydratase family enzyme
MVLDGQRVVPERLLAKGFQFKYPKLHDALENIIHS